jgi:uncharacterized protein YozE (UPF0346 family)
MTTKPTFTAYLSKQVDRHDPIGDLACDVEQDTTWPRRIRTIKGFHDYLTLVRASDYAHDALDMAWAEYTTEGKQPNV